MPTRPESRGPGPVSRRVALHPRPAPPPAPPAANRRRGPAARVLAPLLLGAALAAGCGGPRPEPAGAGADFEFVDRAAEAGLDVRIVCGDPRRWYIPESNGSGAAWLDHDGDGDLDLFLANGARLAYHDDGRRLEVVHEAPCRLYRNDGDWRFTDVTAAALPPLGRWVNGVAVADVDGDGDPDLYLACFDADVLLVNAGGRFEDRTAAWGLGNPLWAASAAFGDADGDGHVDLYVANYCHFDPARPPLEGRRNVVDGVEIGWGPEEENRQGLNPGAPDVYYRNDGRGRFVEATAAAGFALPRPLCSYAVVFADVDGDGHPDVLVANDLQPCNLFVNQGDGTFREEGVARGFAFDARGQATAAMGLAVEDFDGDGHLDVFRTNFDLEPNSLHRNDGRGRFRDVAGEVGLAAPSLDRLGWGCAFLDADLDGELDLLVANGHVLPQAAAVGMSPWLQQSQLYAARRGANGALRYEDVTARAGPGLAPARSARGLAIADVDDDGDLDALLVDLDETPRLLENQSPRRGRWLAIRLRGRAPNTDALGARVEVVAGGRTRVREVRRQQGLYSSHDPRLHFGLGPVARVERVRVRWPGGATTVLEDVAPDRFLSIAEPPPPGPPEVVPR